MIGVFRHHGPAAAIARAGLIAVQHRGEECAGLWVADGQGRTRIAGAGRVVDVLSRPALAELRGSLAVGHVRYSTAGARSADRAQPIEHHVRGGSFSIAHNGNLIGCAALARSGGIRDDPDRTDSELVAILLAKALSRPVRRSGGHPGRVAAGADAAATSSTIAAAGAQVVALQRPAPLERALMATLPRLIGSFSFVLSDGVRLFGARDPKGLRPLCLGRLPDGWVLASETPALTAMGARFVREVQPGELVIIDEAGVRSEAPFPPGTVESRLCLFEYVYFSRPDGVLNGRRIDEARSAAGAALADFAPLGPDSQLPARPGVVVPIPSSAVNAARGYATRSGLPYAEALRRNTSVGRSFLSPTPAERAQKVVDKLVPIPELVSGRRVVVIDDSLVRGTTARAVVDMLRRAGAAEVHLRIASPPWRWPCHFGIDAGDVSELAAGRSAMSEVVAELGCDSLGYLPLDRLAAAVGGTADNYCTGCMTGAYPLPVPTAAPRRTTDLYLSVPPHRRWHAIPLSLRAKGVCA